MPPEKKVLVVDDEASMCDMLTDLLGGEGYGVTTSADGVEALEKLEAEDFDLVLADVRMPRMDGSKLLDEIMARGIPATVILMSAYGDVTSALDAMKRGAFDYIAKPFHHDDVLLTLKKAEDYFRLLRENTLLRSEMRRDFGFESIITRDPDMRELIRTAQKMAKYQSTVLLIGESGTGKELMAKAIHLTSPWAEGNFVAINCGAIPENLLETELFGHAKGAFTDAHRAKKGLFEEASGGSLFLDEIGELPQMLQVKLLRALQEGQIRRVGDTSPIEVSTRIIAATVRDLEKDMRDGRFRSDLFYRLNVLPLTLPPLRRRKDDIPLLAEHFLKNASERLGKPAPALSREAMESLIEYNWPGNIRELENVIERAIVLAEGDRVTPDELPPAVKSAAEEPCTPVMNDDEMSIKKAGRTLEEKLIRKALEQTGGNRTQAAKMLEISHRALLYKIKEYGIDV